MRPTRGDVHIDRALTNLVVNYSPQTYVANRLLPFFGTGGDETGKVWKVDRTRLTGAHGASPDGNRSLRSEDGTAKSITGFDVSSDTYSVEEYALNAPLFDRVRDKADSALRLRQNLAQQVTEQLLQDREIRVIDLVTTAGNWDASHTEVIGATKWTAAAADLRTPIVNAKKLIIPATLGRAQPRDLTVTLSWELFIELMVNTALKDAIKYTGTTLERDLTPALLAQYWDVGEVVVAGAWHNAAGELLTENLTTFWPKSVVTVTYNESPGVNYQGCGVSYTSKSGGLMTRTWREVPRKAEVIEVEMTEDAKIVNDYAGYVITAATA